MKGFDIDSIDGVPYVRHFSPSCCCRCKHFDGIEKGTCAAYPNGIPTRFSDLVSGVNASRQEIHIKIEDDQVGDYIWEFI